MTAAFESALETASAPAAETSPVSTPAPESTSTAPADAGEATAAATAQPASETTETAPVSAEEKPKGEPPQWRWQDILETQRTKAAQEAEARVKQEYEQKVAEYENERRGYTVLTAALNGDPRALAMVAQADPQLAARIRGERAEKSSEPEPEPQPDAAIQLADGSTVPVFTAEGKRRHDAWLQKQLESTLAQKFQPLMTTAERLKEAEQAAQAQAETQRWAAGVMARVQRLPHFAEFKPEILKAIQALPAQHEGPLEDVVYDAYTRLLSAKLESSTKQAETKALADIKQRALASTTPSSSAASATPGTFNKRGGAEEFAKALEHYAVEAR